MGMAASQARFLALTARKSNVEYEGQQINQQRTTLSNTTANYYSDLLGMSVPVPPSVQDYTKTVYTFQDGSITNSITSMIAKGNGLYNISYLQNWIDDFGIVATRSSLISDAQTILGHENTALYDAFVNGTAGGCYTYAMNHKGNQLSHLIHVIEHMLPLGTHTTSDGKSFTITQGPAIMGHYWTTPTADGYGGDGAIMAQLASAIEGKPVQQKIIDLLAEVKEAYDNKNTGKSDELKAKLKDLVENDLKEALTIGYMIGADTLRILGEIGTQDANGNITYNGDDKYLKTLSSDQLAKQLEQENEYIAMLNERYGEDTWFVRYIQNTSSGAWEPYFYKYTDLHNAVYDKYDLQRSHINCYTTGSETKNEEIKGVEAYLEQDSTGRIINITLNPGQKDEVTYAVTTNTVTDQAKYDDAMNQYEYDKAKYDQAIQEINAKIEIIQAEDKNLELRLKQLDTEQDAIQTEMDAVQKVIEKNTESTFKTFG